ncbi:MAG: acyl-CoA dehydratase activase-related protein, partial [Clostridia bacterium]|nr:acyl-CoA dehydratase activase-related protein [Clostridia bacterium]
LYYWHYPMWHTFFTELGLEVVTSDKTNKNILDTGIQNALADACVPVKIFFGHTLSLKNKVDYLFVPRVVCLNNKTIYCPKFLGMPDMLRYGVSKLPPIIDVTMDVRGQSFGLWKAFRQIGQFLKFSSAQIWSAYLKAKKTDRTYRKMLLSGLHPPEAIAKLGINLQISASHASEPPTRPDLTLAVLGYPYEVYDEYISVNLLQKLKKLNVKVITLENIPPRILYSKANEVSKNMFWTFSDLVLRATRYIYRKGLADGVIHLTAFSCGPDSIVDRMMEFTSHMNRQIPFMRLSIDEHSGDAGVSTRLEAFTDMLRRRKEGA